MKLETLNIWGGQICEPLKSHIKLQSEDTDIFCLQEVFEGEKLSPSRIFTQAVMDIYSQLENELPNHHGYLSPSQDNEEGIAMYVNKNISLEKVGDMFVYRWKNAMIDNDARTMGRNMQYIQFFHNNKQFTVMNFHGLWNGQGKTDTSDRIEQSQNIKAFIEKIEGAKILCGDFNLLPDSESMRILEDNMRNLITEFGITSTRSSHYAKPEKYADYILVSSEVEVIDFRVLQDVVSDHLPLQLEFN